MKENDWKILQYRAGSLIARFIILNRFITSSGRPLVSNLIRRFQLETGGPVRGSNLKPEVIPAFSRIKSYSNLKLANQSPRNHGGDNTCSGP